MFSVPLPPSVLMTNNLDGLLISLGTRRIRELVFYLLWLMHLGPPFRPDVPGPITTVLLSLNTGRVWLDDLYRGSVTSSKGTRNGGFCWICRDVSDDRTGLFGLKRMRLLYFCKVWFTNYPTSHDGVHRLYVSSIAIAVKLRGSGLEFFEKKPLKSKLYVWAHWSLDLLKTSSCLRDQEVWRLLKD